MPVRAFWLMVGLVSVAGGVAGIILPLVPTTPFLLLAAFAFARSSPAWHTWLTTHPRLGPPIADWNNHRAISRRAKVWSMIAMVATLGLSVITDVRPMLLAVQAVVLVVVGTFILTRPDRPEA